jgi:hypothetical protein
MELLNNLAVLIRRICNYHITRFSNVNHYHRFVKKFYCTGKSVNFRIGRTGGSLRGKGGSEQKGSSLFNQFRNH